MALITMWDSVTAAGIPVKAAAVAGYLDGTFAWSSSDWDRFPTPFKLSITPGMNSAAMVIDREKGDATDADTVTWAALRRSMGYTPVVYLSGDDLQVNQHAFDVVHEPRPYYWVADWTGTPPASVLVGELAVQYADPSTSGGHYDLSILDSSLFEELFMTTPDPNLDGFVYAGGPSTGAATPQNLGTPQGPAGVSPTSVFGRVVMAQGMLQVLSDPTDGVLAVLEEIQTELATLKAAVAALSPTSTPVSYTASGNVILTPEAN